MNKNDIASKITRLLEKLHQQAINLEKNPFANKELLDNSRELNELIAHYNYLLEADDGQNDFENTIDTVFAPEEHNDEKLAGSDQPKEEMPTTTDDQPLKDESGDTINTKFESIEGSNWGATLNKKPISNLKTDIGINERFLLIKELFGGNTEDFNQSIETLEGCSSRTEAIECFNNNLADKYGWDDESEALDVFLNLLTRRYSI